MSNYSIKLSCKYLFKVAIAPLYYYHHGLYNFLRSKDISLFKVAISFFEEQMQCMFTLFEK